MRSRPGDLSCPADARRDAAKRGIIDPMTSDSDRPIALGPGEPAAPGDAPLPAFAAPDRPRGLDAYFPPGGEDEAPPERVADERRMTRLLVLMVVLLVGVPTLLTLIALVGQLISLRGGG
jgi:hypothetical protein